MMIADDDVNGHDRDRDDDSDKNYDDSAYDDEITCLDIAAFVNG